MSGCENKHRARGLCSTHYNQMHQPNRHAAYARECENCGAPVLRPTHNDRRPVCSVSCRTELQHGRATVSGYDWATDAATRARKAGAVVVELFDRTEIFERDEWCCYLCGEDVDRDIDSLDARSATVDHVVPLVLGGVHSRDNTRCAHHGCNSRKADALLSA